MAIESDLFLDELSARIFGLLPSLPEEVETAKKILAAAPTKGPALDVALYFANLSAKNAEGEPYNSEWKSRANPLIVSFFRATNFGTPEGDTTKWCAAFMNWCLQRVGQPSTRSASSGSFRCFGNEVSAPSRGDIAVFKNLGEDDRCAGTGHVAFWMSEKPQRVQVLGGNQGGKATISWMSTTPEGGSPWLLTVRRI